MSIQPYASTDLTYLPVTYQQFQDLTNELLDEINKLMDPHFIDGEYMAQVLMATIHSLDHKLALVSKEDLFNGCVNRISNHVTYAAVKAIQDKHEAEAAAKAVPGSQSSVSLVPDAPQEA
jgi:hypothetical protein